MVILDIDTGYLVTLAVFIIFNASRAVAKLERPGFTTWWITFQVTRCRACQLAKRGFTMLWWIARLVIICHFNSIIQGLT